MNTVGLKVREWMSTVLQKGVGGGGRPRSCCMDYVKVAVGRTRLKVGTAPQCVKNRLE